MATEKDFTPLGSGSNVSISNGEIDWGRVEVAVRCHECDRLLSRIWLTISLPPELQTMKRFSVSELFPELEVKVEIENKCLRCKNMDYRIFVV